MRAKLMTPEEQEVHADALRILNTAGIHYVVSGAVALGHYTGIWRNTKDLDLFLVRTDLTAALTTLAAHGYVTRTPAQHWLAHAHRGNYYVDLIHGFGGWRAAIDEEWYARGPSAVVLGQPVRIAPVEELIWIKAYVGHRERFDGADIVHLIQACHECLDWDHLLQRFTACWQLLAFYLNLYEFIYPTNRSHVPAWVRQDLLERWKQEQRAPAAFPPICRGPLLDRFSFLIDVTEGWRDGRVPWAEAQGWTGGDIARDRAEAERMVEEGRVRPERVA
jgi:hypothetical protein